jgi:DMSO/TMAO reductase YedYZ molybdopterin-dependent catalytic subunit
MMDSSNKAERIKRMKVPTDGAFSDRVPPGQTVTERFPILHEGNVPEYDMSKWSLRIFGEVEKEKVFSYEDLLAMPQTQITCDIHCVTRWSKLDTVWEGVLFRDFLQHINIKPEGKFVMLHADNEYETNVPLVDLLGDQILLAFKYDGQALTKKHGWPLRLLVPHLYFWKSAKWVLGIEFMKENREGFWEQNGFHNIAEPFKEQRFSSDNMYLPEDEWVGKDFD